ncbi:MAG: preprotein translocase subunit YajC [Candidatus Omnitrophica bacterium]|nr:preprotein translocase subunit YajC [Candidatus Omnitrophota bacterium]
MQPAAQSAGLINFIPLILIFLVFYFLLIKPQKQKEKEHQKMIHGLERNNEVVTTGGVHGTIVGVKEKTFILRVDENVKIEIEKSAVASLLK